MSSWSARILSAYAAEVTQLATDRKRESEALNKCRGGVVVGWLLAASATVDASGFSDQTLQPASKHCLVVA